MDTQQYVKFIKDAAEYIMLKDARRPEIAIILGTGLGNFADEITDKTVIPYGSIPGFPISTALGHKGNFIIGMLGGKCVLAMQGRIHFYEGYGMQLVTIAERVMSVMGIKYLFVSNAAGGLNQNFKVGDLMLIEDHINMMPNPLIGPNLEEFGTRFPDMGNAYDKTLLEHAGKCASELGIKLQKGVYVAVTGPTFETPAECKCYHIMGADAIGMSTVPEVIVARHCGIKVFGISVITDIGKFSRDDESDSVSHEEVLAAADLAAGRMNSLFKKMISEM